VAVADVTRRESEREPLIRGREMRCPRCRELHDVLLYVPMGQVDQFSSETNPVYKCPKCRWIFSPAQTLEERLRDAVALLRECAPELLTESARSGPLVLVGSEL
jgi:phage FluMu protein Com